jgi:hypothetical protein
MDQIQGIRAVDERDLDQVTGSQCLLCHFHTKDTDGDGTPDVLVIDYCVEVSCI